jgi:dienelactone hydrolase
MRIPALVLAAAVAALPLRAGVFTHEQALALRARLRASFFIPDPLPPLEPQVTRRFHPAPGVAAEAVTYATQLGTRVPAIVYRPDPLPPGRIPALVVITGHAGDKYSWYSYYTGILYARAGALVVTYDQIGEGERNATRRSATRAHDTITGDEEMGRRLNGLMQTDAMQGVSYARSRPEVDPARVGVLGFSLGSLVGALDGALDPRPRVVVLVGGGNLTIGPGHWDAAGHAMCQGYAYGSLKFLGDRPAYVYALQADRGPTLLWNGRQDHVTHQEETPDAFYADMRRRTIALRGSEENVFTYGWNDAGGHRPYWVTKPVALWLQRQLNFPNWTEARIAAMPEINIGRWAQGTAVDDPAVAAESRPDGTVALADDIPGYAREDLSVFTPAQWDAVKAPYVMEAWVAAARAAEAAERR